MKEYIKKLSKTVLLHIIAIPISLGVLVTFAAVSWPSASPSGEPDGGKFMVYFTKIFTDCPGGTVLKGYNTDKDPICGSIGSSEIATNAVGADAISADAVALSEIDTDSVDDRYRQRMISTSKSQSKNCPNDGTNCYSTGWGPTCNSGWKVTGCTARCNGGEYDMDLVMSGNGCRVDRNSACTGTTPTLTVQAICSKLETY